MTLIVTRRPYCNRDQVIAGGKALAAIDRDLEMRPAPMISVECLLNLRDDDEAVCWCQPGSHLDDSDPTTGLTEALVPVHVPRGGCVIFHRRLLRERQVGSFIHFR